jgi:hypothetical protein
MSFLRRDNSPKDNEKKQMAQPTVTMSVTGYNGQIRIEGDWLIIERKKLGRLGHSKGDKRIALSTITAVKMRPAGRLANGFIRFDQLGGTPLRDSRGGLSDANTNENAVIFLRKHQPEFDSLRAYIESYITNKLNPTHIQSSASVTDQLRDLGALFKSGVLTQNEFEKKKAELLSRL